MRDYYLINIYQIEWETNLDRELTIKIYDSVTEVYDSKGLWSLFDCWDLKYVDELETIEEIENEIVVGVLEVYDNDNGSNEPYLPACKYLIEKIIIKKQRNDKIDLILS